MLYSLYVIVIIITSCKHKISHRRKESTPLAGRLAACIYEHQSRVALHCVNMSILHSLGRCCKPSPGARLCSVTRLCTSTSSRATFQAGRFSRLENFDLGEAATEHELRHVVELPLLSRSDTCTNFSMNYDRTLERRSNSHCM